MAKTVAHVDLSDHVVGVVFTLFDENSKSVYLLRNKNLCDQIVLDIDMTYSRIECLKFHKLIEALN